MPIEDCQKKIRHPIIVVEERGRKAAFLNPRRLECVVTQFDGCVVTNQPAADKIVTCSIVGDIIVELKGRDVDHAVTQINATARYWHGAGMRVGRVAGLIVARQFPRASTKVQRAQQSFSRQFKGPLHVVTKNYQYTFEQVLAYDGPL